LSVAVEFVDIGWRGRSVRIEHAWIGRGHNARPLAIFLHEGLGSLSSWKDFPQRLCEATGWRGLVYSRPGYGRSTARDADEHWGVDFMHRQAHEVLPALLTALQIDEPVRLFGHSDGASIALLYASRFPTLTGAAVVLAPHVMVEDVSITSIQETRRAYAHTELRHRLARHHDDVDSAFWGWNDIWLDPAFRSWNIEAELDGITCPLLAIQGVDDEYGTLEQLHCIQRRLPSTRLVELRDCGHSPHRDQPDRVIAACAAFEARG
jgi:pimeloyl-ACP methyl ester carboxylesterase